MPMQAAFKPDREFGSLTDCMSFIADRYARMRRVWPRRESGVFLPDLAPAYLFRGECGTYPTTLPAIYRASTWNLRDGRILQSSDRAALHQLISALERRFTESDYGLDASSSTALVQHYGLPTQILDFTAHSGYAASFAVAGESSVGRICVLPTRALEDCIKDLSEHPWGERPQRQMAFGVLLPRQSVDLKLSWVREQLGVCWYEFPIADDDRTRLLPEYRRIVDVNDDPSAGFLRHRITEYVETAGKLSSTLTEWLLEKMGDGAHRIPMVPCCYRVMRFDWPDVVVRHQPAALLGVNDYSNEVEWSRRYLSAAYPDSSRDRLTGWNWPKVGSVVADPRTYHELPAPISAVSPQMPSHATA
jgi:hypothetical protein